MEQESPIEVSLVSPKLRNGGDLDMDGDKLHQEYEHTESLEIVKETQHDHDNDHQDVLIEAITSFENENLNHHQYRSNRNAMDTNETDVDERSQESEGSDDEGDHWRVKVYFLDRDGTWADMGTGYATCRQAAESSFIIVYDEHDDGNIIHKSKILSSECYERQGESIIMWKEINDENGKEYDVALSFQNPAGCLSAWNLIGTLSQPAYAYQYGNHALRLLGENEEMFMNVGKYTFGSPNNRRDSGNIALPDCTAANLVEIRNVLNNSNGAYNDAHVGRFLADDAAYFKKLMHVFADLEDLEDIVGLRVIADIMRSVLLFNDSGLLDFILNEDIFVQVLGIMEYDQSLREQAKYREFITGKANLVEVFPLKNELRQEIKKYFNVKFLKEIVIRPLLDENGVTCINSLLTFSAINICDDLFIDKEYMGKILMEISKAGNACTKKVVDSEFLADGGLGVTINSSGSIGTSTNSSSSSSSSSSSTHGNGHDNGNGPDNGNGIDVQNGDGDHDRKGRRSEEGPSMSKSHLSLLFLRELFFLSRTIPIDRRYEMYMNFCEHLRSEFFGAMHSMLLIPPEVSTGNFWRSERSLAAEILTTLASAIPAVVRSFVLEGPTPLPPPNVVSQSQRHNILDEKNDSTNAENVDFNSKCLLYVIIRLVGACDDVPEIEQLTEILRCMLDADRIEKLEKDKFLQLFYDYHVHWLLVPFNTVPGSSSSQSSSSSSSNGGKDSANANTKNYSSVPVPAWVGMAQSTNSIVASRRCLCELLCLCAQGHSYRMKYFVMRNNVIGRVFSVLGTGHKQLYLGAIKFMRAILNTKDEFYYRHIQKIDLMRPMFEALGEFEGRDNLIVSSILEIVEYVRSENVKVLIEYIVDKYSSKLQSLDHVETYDKLLIRFEQMKDGERNGLDEMNSRGSSSGSGEPKIGSFENLGDPHAAVIRNKHLAEREREDDYFEDDDDDNGNDNGGIYNISGSGYEHSRVVSDDDLDDYGNVDRNGLDDYRNVDRNGQDLDSKRPPPFSSSFSLPGAKSNPLSVLSSMYGDDNDDGDENSDVAGTRNNGDNYENHSPDDGSALKKSRILSTDQIDIFSSLPPLAAKPDEDEHNAFSTSGIVKKNVQKKSMGFQINIKPNGN